MESTRAKEAAVKKETSEQLEAFRKQREAAEASLLDEAANLNTSIHGNSSAPDQESWTTSSKKRRRTKDKDAPIAKIRRKSTAEESPQEAPNSATSLEVSNTTPPSKDAAALQASDVSEKPSYQVQSSVKVNVPVAPGAVIQARPVPSSLGLGVYSSDED